MGRAQYFVANYYSTVMGVALTASVPIVEFSEYCDSAPSHEGLCHVDRYSELLYKQ